MSRSSSGLGRRPLKAEITSSNLVRDVFFCLILYISLLLTRSDTSALTRACRQYTSALMRACRQYTSLVRA